MNYHTITKGMIIKPVTEPIFSEQATTVELEDEAAGLFLVIRQVIRQSGRDGDSKISVTAEEWPMIREAVEQMLRVVEEAEQKERACITQRK